MDNNEFTMRIQNLLVSKNGYVLDIGTQKDVNKEIILRLEENIKNIRFYGNNSLWWDDSILNE